MIVLRVFGDADFRFGTTKLIGQILTGLGHLRVQTTHSGHCTMVLSNIFTDILHLFRQIDCFASFCMVLYTTDISLVYSLKSLGFQF